ncbi:MAG: phosphate transporter permease, partial [Jatrophihabitans sp.]|nr:phosphate transporter permease [Jatrophihabitans sp.]
GMISSVVLPFGRGGIIGGTMLGLGRALGETIAVLLIFHDTDGAKWRILTANTRTISSLIANNVGDATGGQRGALMAAGFVLFLLTLAVNTIAAVFVTRSRSGSVS